MNNSYDDLLARAKRGKLTAQEISAVVGELQRPDSSKDRYTLLHILGRSGATAYRRLVEQFLECREEPMLARLALKILCDYWTGTAQYIPKILGFLRGLDGDEESDVRQIAISIVGEYLRNNPEPEFLRELIHIFGNEENEQTIREDAYIALARAMGRDWNQLPSSAKHFDLTSQTDPMILHEAKERLFEEESYLKKHDVQTEGAFLKGIKLPDDLEKILKGRKNAEEERPAIHAIVGDSRNMLT